MQQPSFPARSQTQFQCEGPPLPSLLGTLAALGILLARFRLLSAAAASAEWLEQK